MRPDKCKMRKIGKLNVTLLLNFLLYPASSGLLSSGVARRRRIQGTPILLWTIS